MLNYSLFDAHPGSGSRFTYGLNTPEQQERFLADLKQEHFPVDPGFLYFADMVYKLCAHYAQNPDTNRFAFYEEALCLLVAQGAQINYLSSTLQTPLDLLHNTPLAKVLIDAGALTGPEFSQKYMYFHRNTYDHPFGYDFLSFAAKKRDMFHLEALLQQPDTDVDHQDRRGFTALMYALVPLKGLPVDLEVVRYLLVHGAYPNHRAKYGISVLQLAVDLGDLDVLQCLIDFGMELNPTSKDSKGKALPDYFNQGLYYRPLAFRQHQLIQSATDPVISEALCTYSQAYLKQLLALGMTIDASIIARAPSIEPDWPLRQTERCSLRLKRRRLEAGYLSYFEQKKAELLAYFPEFAPIEGASEEELQQKEDPLYYRLPLAYRCFAKVMGKRPPPYLFGCDTYDFYYGIECFDDADRYRDIKSPVDVRVSDFGIVAPNGDSDYFYYRLLRFLSVGNGNKYAMTFYRYDFSEDPVVYLLNSELYYTLHNGGRPRSSGYSLMEWLDISFETLFEAKANGTYDANARAYDRIDRTAHRLYKVVEPNFATLPIPRWAQEEVIERYRRWMPEKHPVFRRSSPDA